MLISRRDDLGIATLTLNRPEKRNALDVALMVALREQIDRLATDESVGCVILTGERRSFCAGHDLESIARGSLAVQRRFWKS